MEESNLKALRKMIKKSSKNTLKQHEKKMAKKAARASNRIAEKDLELLASMEAGLTNCGQSGEKVITSTDVENWFREGIEDNYGATITLPPENRWWRPKEKSLAKKLLEEYGPELVKKAVLYLCENWEKMVEGSGGKLQGMPTIEFLWGARARIVPDAERGREYKVSPAKPKLSDNNVLRHDAAEYSKKSRRIGVGWGD